MTKQDGHRPKQTPEERSNRNAKQNPLPAYERPNRGDEFHISQTHGFSRKFGAIGSPVQFPDLCQRKVMSHCLQAIMKKTKIQILAFLAVDSHFASANQNLIPRP